MKLPRLFRSKKQVEIIKEIPLLHAARTISKQMDLSSINLTYDVARSDHKYYAYVDYKERPTNWTDPGLTERVKLEADNWPDLIDMVVKHFEESGVTQ